ncbi:hypothetical protein OH76DRAFT_464777 [Lentinus brumalis]|uniref:F-box domain-containing protein n=1 Tax=Lentinus brumalis TaxID=2498619 RepID=A0A371DCK6_9APHY|nr:hypothetical protein OH76DRAFT_464777 [Polyporus brumalis]
MPGYPIALQNTVDVWHLILSVVDHKTTLALVKTCHILNQQASPYLLRDVVLQGLGPRKLSSFLQFIGPRNGEEESAYRLRSLRDLSLEIAHPPPRIDALLALFTRLQRQAINLTRLRVSVDDMAATLLNPEVARLGAAIASLQHIRDLDLELLLPMLFYEILHATRSRLVSLKLTPHGQAINPIPLLLNSRDTLEKLDTHLPWIDASPCYPRMRDLTIVCPFMPRIPHLVATFPNLEALRISSRSEDDAETSMWHEDPFPLLRLFHGNLDDLYMLGVRHRLDRLKIHIRGSDLDVSRLFAVLSQTSPSHLSLEIGPLVSGECFEDPEFVSLFSQSLLPNLVSLAFDVTWGPDDWNVETDDIDVSGLAASTSPPLQYLTDIVTIRKFWKPL